MPRPDLKTTFNTVASLYDEVRPGYPDELVRDVLDLSEIDRSGKILEVGCGTGQASRLFATLGCGNDLFGYWPRFDWDCEGATQTTTRNVPLRPVSFRRLGLG